MLPYLTRFLLFFFFEPTRLKICRSEVGGLAIWSRFSCSLVNSRLLSGRLKHLDGIFPIQTPSPQTCSGISE